MAAARCRFFRVGCSGEDHPLFRSEYTRYKPAARLLRCFPHCCPDHVPRGFCGCSLNLLVTFSDDNAVPNPDQILDGVVYVLNNHRSPKWFYGFTSGATKAQRDMRHTLVVYVFRLLSPPLDRQQAQPDPSGRPLHASVLARQASPSFTIGSHRRAYNTQGREASVTAPDSQTERVSSEEVTIQSVAVDARNNLYEASSEDEDAPAVVLESRSDDAGVGRTVDVVEERLEETKEHVEKDNAMFWHLDDLPRHSDVAEKTKHLLLLRFFLGAATIDVFDFMLPRLDNHIRANWFGTSLLGRFPPTHVDELTAAFSLAAFQVAAPRR
ncbi:hypothetical protein BBJ28_00024655 [Nothophytophthora sp. Chile5]|nr:hypothetical protein BBJ28_00024655 [Nothophytophthora sp. Chile5]